MAASNRQLQRLLLLLPLHQLALLNLRPRLRLRLHLQLSFVHPLPLLVGCCTLFLMSLVAGLRLVQRHLQQGLQDQQQPEPAVDR